MDVWGGVQQQTYPASAESGVTCMCAQNGALNQHHQAQNHPACAAHRPSIAADVHHITLLSTKVCNKYTPVMLCYTCDINVVVGFLVQLFCFPLIFRHPSSDNAADDQAHHAHKHQHAHEHHAHTSSMVPTSNPPHGKSDASS